MKTGVEALHQNHISDSIHFIRGNELAREIDGTLAITRKGERFLHELRRSLKRSNSGMSSGI
jgi:hypothetical protein